MHTSIENISKPTTQPAKPNFSSGPCAKFTGWSFDAISTECLGRSHRSQLARKKLAQLIEETYTVLNVPKDYKIAIVPASDTGAVEMALWNIAGCVGTDVYYWDSFGRDWAEDVQCRLKLDDLNVYAADFGEIPNLVHNPERDCIFTYNGTTAGVKVPDLDWIHTERTGLTVCDATSAVFLADMDWDKLDITTWSWQKCLGGEASHGMIMLSPRAVERLKTHTPPFAIPKIFSFMKNGEFNEVLFKGEVINTPSMYCVEEVLTIYKWVREVGGIPYFQQKNAESYALIKKWVEARDWMDFACKNEAYRSPYGVCINFTLKGAAPYICQKLEELNVAYDINSYFDAPEGIRLWIGPTGDTDDVKHLLPWIDWAYKEFLAQ